MKNLGLAAYKPSKVDLAKRAKLLDSTKWLNECEWAQIEIFAQYIDVYELPGLVEICEEGAKDGYLALIQEGTVKVIKRSSDDKRKTVCTLGAGKAFGEVSLVDGFPRSASVVSSTTVTLLVLSQESFNRLSSSHPKLATILLTKLCKLLSARLRQTSGKLAEYLQ